MRREDFRFRTTLALYVIAVAIGIGAIWQTTLPAPFLPPIIAQAAFFGGIVFAVLFGFFLVFMLDYLRWPEPIQDVPRWRVSATLLVAGATAFATVAFIDTVAVVLLGGEPTSYAVATTLAVAAGAVRLFVEANRLPRHTITAGGLLLFASMVTLNRPVESAFGLALGMVVLVHVWTAESTPETRRSDDSSAADPRALWRAVRTLDVRLAVVALAFASVVGVVTALAWIRIVPLVGVGAFAGSLFFLYDRSSVREAVVRGLYLVGFSLLFVPAMVTVPSLTLGEFPDVGLFSTPTRLLASGLLSVAIAGALAGIGQRLDRRPRRIG